MNNFYSPPPRFLYRGRRKLYRDKFDHLSYSLLRYRLSHELPTNPLSVSAEFTYNVRGAIREPRRALYFLGNNTIDLSRGIRGESGWKKAAHKKSGGRIGGRRLSYRTCLSRD